MNLQPGEPPYRARLCRWPHGAGSVFGECDVLMLSTNCFSTLAVQHCDVFAVAKAVR
jgi:hypothetical protein